MRANFPANHFATQVNVKFAVPRTSTGVTFELPKGTQGQATEYKDQEHSAVWQIKKFQGGHEHFLIAKITLPTPTASEFRKEIGPVQMTFEIPMYNVSKLQVQYLKIANPGNIKKFNPHRWVRYVTQSSSYVCRC